LRCQPGDKPFTKKEKRGGGGPGNRKGHLAQKDAGRKPHSPGKKKCQKHGGGERLPDSKKKLERRENSIKKNAIKENGDMFQPGNHMPWKLTCNFNIPSGVYRGGETGQIANKFLSRTPI